MTTWYNLATYTPVWTSSTAGTLGGVGGGWTDPNSQWKLVNLGGGANDAAIQTTYGSSSSWVNAQLVRQASAEATVNTRVRVRWQSNGSTYSSAVWAAVRYVKNTTDATNNALITRLASAWATAAGALSGSQQNGIVTSGGYVSGNWYDTSITSVTSGSTTAINESTYTVANHLTSTFASGTLISASGGNAFSATLYPGVSGGIGVFFYQPGTAGNINFFASDTDQPATALSLSPSSVTSAAGSATTFTVSVTGAQNGGSVTLSDGGAGGIFTPANVAMPTGVNASATFAYTSPATGGRISITASSSALTGSALSSAAAVTATASAAAAPSAGAAALAGAPVSDTASASATPQAATAALTMTVPLVGGSAMPSPVASALVLSGLGPGAATRAQSTPLAAQMAVSGGAAPVAASAAPVTLAGSLITSGPGAGTSTGASFFPAAASLSSAGQQAGSQGGISATAGPETASAVASGQTAMAGANAASAPAPAAALSAAVGVGPFAAASLVAGPGAGAAYIAGGIASVSSDAGVTVPDPAAGTTAGLPISASADSDAGPGGPASETVAADAPLVSADASVSQTASSLSAVGGTVIAGQPIVTVLRGRMLNGRLFGLNVGVLAS